MNWDFSPQILIQGINQVQAINYLQNCPWAKEIVVVGIADEYVGDAIEDIPIFDLVSSAIDTYPDITTSLVFSQSEQVLDVCYEAIFAGIKQIVIFSGDIPIIDLMSLYQKAQEKNVHILGSSGGGILQSQSQYNCGINHGHLIGAGNIGMINFAHPNLAEEIVGFLQKADFGISSLINVGNSYFSDINWDLCLNILQEDTNTELIVIIISEISLAETEKLIGALSPITDLPITIYLVNSEDYRSQILGNPPKVISDQVYNYLEPRSSLELLQIYDFADNITITNNYKNII